MKQEQVMKMSKGERPLVMIMKVATKRVIVVVIVAVVIVAVVTMEIMRGNSYSESNKSEDYDS